MQPALARRPSQVFALKNIPGVIGVMCQACALVPAKDHLYGTHEVPKKSMDTSWTDHGRMIWRLTFWHSNSHTIFPENPFAKLSKYMKACRRSAGTVLWLRRHRDC